MKNQFLIVLVYSLLSSSPTFGAGTPPNDQEVLQGIWQAIAVVDGGTAEYADRVALLKLKIKGDHYTYDFGDHSFSADFKIDPTKAPKEIDVTFLEGPQTGKTMKAIYSLDGDTLKICVEPYARPAEFASTLEAQSILFTFERDLPSKDITSAEILAYGIFGHSPIASTEGRTDGGTPLVVASPKLLEQTLTVPATLNIQFGYQFVVHGSPAGKKVKLRVATLFPPTTDEITGKTTTQDAFNLQVGLEDNKDVAVFLTLDKRSDLVPGTWTIQVFDHDKKLLEKSFSLVKP